MTSEPIYQCPKCFNKLLYSNKMLHDLKCTRERPADYSQVNPVASFNYDYENNTSYQNPGYRKSVGRMSILNDDGTTTEIKKDMTMKGEELLEITYDPQGNIIGRKKADGGRSSVRFNFHELPSTEYTTTYNVIYQGNNEYVETIPSEVVYETVTYVTPVTTYELPEHDFGNRGYSLMDNNIDNANMVTGNDLNDNNENYFNDNNINNNYYDSNSLDVNANNNISNYYSNDTNNYGYNNYTYETNIQNNNENLNDFNQYSTKTANPQTFAKVTKLPKRNNNNSNY